MNKKLFILLFIASIYAQTDGEVVHNVQASQRTDGSKILDVSYELYPNELYTSYDVNISIQGGALAEPFYLLDCSGDVFFNIHYSGLTKQASCYLTHSELEEVLSGDFYINVHANGYAASELPDSFEFVTYESSYSPNDNEGNMTFNIFDCEELISTNLESLISEPYEGRPRFELMKNEVTAAQYVEFLQPLLDNALSMENNDSIELGIMNRTYYFDDNKQIVIEFNQNDGTGNLRGWKSELVYPFGPSSYVNTVWLELNEISVPWDDNTDVFPSTSGLGNNDLSLLVTPQNGNNAIINVTFEGALAFARHYGLRLPVLDEMVQAAFPIGPDGQIDTFFEDLLNGDWINEIFAAGHESDAGLFVNRIILGVSEYTYKSKNRAEMAIFGGSIVGVTGQLEFCDLDGSGSLVGGSGSDLEQLELVLYGLTYRVYGGFDASWYSNSAGFRCARTLSGDE